MAEKNFSNNMVFFETIMSCVAKLKLSAEEKLTYYEGVINYGLHEIEPNFENPVLDAIFNALRPHIDANNRRKQQALLSVENGKKGGRPRKNASSSAAKENDVAKDSDAAKTQKKTPSKTLDSDIDRDSDSDSDRDSDNEETKDISFISSSSSSKEKEKENVKKVLVEDKDDDCGEEPDANDEPDTDEDSNTEDNAPAEDDADTCRNSHSDKQPSTHHSVSSTPQPQLTLKERNDVFFTSLLPYVDHYGLEAVQSFYDYWAEPNDQIKKMRFEQEKSWNLNYRLQRWMSKRQRLGI